MYIHIYAVQQLCYNLAERLAHPTVAIRWLRFASGTRKEFPDYTEFAVFFFVFKHYSGILT